jgi:glycosyltransferase involved in cell wall biosynthesis
MQQHDVLLYPSFGFDNQPMVLLEAVAAGTPIVYCDPDLTECMPSDGCLITRDGTTVEALTLALKDLLANPDQRMKMHQAMLNHRNKVVQSYHSKKMVALYEKVAKK